MLSHCELQGLPSRIIFKTSAYSEKPLSIFGSALPSQYYVGVTLAQPTLPLHPGTNTVKFDTFLSYKSS